MQAITSARAIEDWVVRNMGSDAEFAPLVPDIGNWMPAKVEADRAVGYDRPQVHLGPGGGWARLTVVRKGDVLVVRVGVKALIKENVLEEIADELKGLLNAGSARVVLDLSEVERIASPFVATLAEMHRICSARPGGAVRLCGLIEHLQPLLALTGLDREIENFPDERLARLTPWPGDPGLAPLPVSVLQPLVESMQKAGAMESALRALRPGEEPAGPRLLMHLTVNSGANQGLRIPVRGSEFLIGRDDTCHLRCRAAKVSRRHARIRRVGQSWQIKDEGSLNGTFRNGVRIQGTQPLADGDELDIGGIKLLVRIEAGSGNSSTFDQSVAGWMVGPDTCVRDEETVDATSLESMAADPHTAHTTAGYQVVEGVVVLTPRLETSEDIDELRETLAGWAARGGAHVVINLERVGSILSRAVGVLLSQALQIAHSGGKLRLAAPQAPVRARLEWLRVHELLELFTSLDEAIILGWD